MGRGYQRLDTASVGSFTSNFNQFVANFDYEYRPLSPSLVSKLQLCLIDVGSGSDTRLMVRQVLEWSQTKAREESGTQAKQFQDSCFKRLNRLNG